LSAALTTFPKPQAIQATKEKISQAYATGQSQKKAFIMQMTQKNSETGQPPQIKKVPSCLTLPLHQFQTPSQRYR